MRRDEQLGSRGRIPSWRMTDACGRQPSEVAHGPDAETEQHAGADGGRRTTRRNQAEQRTGEGAVAEVCRQREPLDLTLRELAADARLHGETFDGLAWRQRPRRLPLQA